MNCGADANATTIHRAEPQRLAGDRSWLPHFVTVKNANYVVAPRVSRGIGDDERASVRKISVDDDFDSGELLRAVGFGLLSGVDALAARIVDELREGSEE